MLELVLGVGGLVVWLALAKSELPIFFEIPDDPQRLLLPRKNPKKAARVDNNLGNIVNLACYRQSTVQ